MKVQPVQEEHFGVLVWVNPTLEAIRHDECLCWNCALLKPEQPDNCSIAQRLYELCCETHIATPVTRCPVWQLKKEV